MYHSHGPQFARNVLSSISTSSNDSYEASHLCHYRGCANPDHLFVESRKTNTERNKCAGLFAWRVVDGQQVTMLHPCPHRTQAADQHAVKECILPVCEVGANGWFTRPVGFLGAGEV